MTDRDALWRAIIEDPDDDAPRLVFADWLDEHGDSEQAEYIRVHCALGDPNTPAEDREALARRARTLTGWRPPNLPGITWGDHYDRGYPRRIDADGWPALKAAWETMFACAPVVWVTVPGLSPADLDELLAR